MVKDRLARAAEAIAAALGWLFMVGILGYVVIWHLCGGHVYLFGGLAGIFRALLGLLGLD